jgi:DNA-binding CsgD family transcriptional regulator
MNPHPNVHLERPSEQLASNRSVPVKLSGRQVLVLRELSLGYTAAEIQRKHGIPVRVINYSRHRVADLLVRLGVRDANPRTAPVLIRLLETELFASDEDRALRSQVFQVLRTAHPESTGPSGA